MAYARGGRAPPRQLNIETLVTAATAEYKLLARRERANAKVVRHIG